MSFHYVISLNYATLACGVIPPYLSPGAALLVSFYQRHQVCIPWLKESERATYDPTRSALHWCHAWWRSPSSSPWGIHLGKKPGIEDQNQNRSNCEHSQNTIKTKKKNHVLAWKWWHCQFWGEYFKSSSCFWFLIELETLIWGDLTWGDDSFTQGWKWLKIDWIP